MTKVINMHMDMNFLQHFQNLVLEPKISQSYAFYFANWQNFMVLRVFNVH